MSPLLLHSNTNRYNINGLLCTYTEMFRKMTCCNHILSAAEGFGDRRQHARIQEFAEKIMLILYQGSRVAPLFSGGVQLFPGGGPNTNFYRNPYTYLLFSRGGCTDHLSPSGSAHGQCHHNWTIFITVPLLTMILRHWFVRINDR